MSRMSEEDEGTALGARRCRAKLVVTCPGRLIFQASRFVCFSPRWISRVIRYSLACWPRSAFSSGSGSDADNRSIGWAGLRWRGLFCIPSRDAGKQPFRESAQAIAPKERPVLVAIGLVPFLCRGGRWSGVRSQVLGSTGGWRRGFLPSGLLVEHLDELGGGESVHPQRIVGGMRVAQILCRGTVAVRRGVLSV